MIIMDVVLFQSNNLLKIEEKIKKLIQKIKFSFQTLF